MALKCPKCQTALEVRLTAAPPMQADEARRESSGGGDIGALLDAIDDHSLKGASVSFVEQTRERFEKYGSNTRLSPKQIAWLEKLAGVGGNEDVF